MKKLKEKLVARIIELRRKGKSYKNLAKKLSLSPATVYKYSKQVNLSNEIIKKLKNNIVENQNSFSKKYSKNKKIKKISRFTSQLARIISHCLFDGCVFKDKNSDYAIRYTNSSKQEIKRFTRDFYYVFGIKPTYVLYKNGKDCGWGECGFLSKNATEYLHNYIKDYSTSSQQCSLKNLLPYLNNEQTKIEFLKCFWSDEGCVDFKGQIHGKSKSLKIIKQLRELHKTLGIKSTIWVDNTSKNYALYILKSKENLNKFSRIGFGEGIVTRGKYLGLRKQIVFENVLKRYQ